MFEEEKIGFSDPEFPLKYVPFGNCKIIVRNSVYYLKSYNTIVASAEINYKGDDVYLIIKCKGLYSATTRKHISAFAKELRDKTGCEMISYYDFKQSYEDNCYVWFTFDLNEMKWTRFCEI